MDLHETHEEDPFRILIGTIISARTKDETTTKVCKKLFKKIKSFEDIKKTSLEELQELIYPAGFYRTKAKNIKELATLVNEVPETMEGLLKLPSVGRKTANLVLHLAFGKPAICVDTHVHRIMNRIGYVKTRNPQETEMELRKKLPKKLWPIVNSHLVAYGQHTCTPISPKCSECRIRKLCSRVEVTKSR